MKRSTMFQAEPKAQARAIVKKGSCRFTILSSQLIRCEFAADGAFEDRATLTVVHRNTPLPQFRLDESELGVVIYTEHVTLTCSDTSRAFTPETLSAEFTLIPGSSEKGQYRFGQAESGNLGGTARTLDGCDGPFKCAWRNNQIVPDETSPLTIEPGLLSRDGFVTVDDTQGILLTPLPDTKTLWCTARPPGERQDLYLLLHGRDYKAALRDAALVFGRQPLPPRYAFGYWFCRYWAYIDRELEELVRDHDAFGIPLDVLVIDMDWHQLGWTGYTWSKELFPDHQETLGYLREHGMKISLNLHPADGVSKEEQRYSEFRKAMGEANAKKVQTKDGAIPFDCTDPNFMRAYFSVLHHPLEREGVDFWWMDWQQGQASKVPGLDPLPWLNYTHYRDQAERQPNIRPLVFTRYGGLGSGRHPVGFSGDTTSNWSTLAYQPGFTARSANALFGHWSHDIGGHFSLPEPEVYVRWLQFGAYSPILRTHSTKSHTNERRIYDLKDPHRNLGREAIRRRYELVPYIASEWRTLIESGDSLLRPMYHEHPEEDDAYRCDGQYYFGSQMIVRPVTHAADPDTEESRFSAWLPAGSWIETSTGKAYGSGWHEHSATLAEVPVYVRPGAVIPGLYGAARLKPGSYPTLLVDVWSGGNGGYTLFEDDGETLGYTRGDEAQIELVHTEAKGVRTIRISKAKGTFTGFQCKRPVRVRIHLAAPPESVQVGKQKLPQSHRPQPGHTNYDGDTFTTFIDLPLVDLSQDTTLTIRERALSNQPLDGLPGLMRRLQRAMQLTLEISYYRPLHPEERLCAELAQTGNRISRNPGKIVPELNALKRDLPRLERALKEHQDAIAVMKEVGHRSNATRVARARRMVASAIRGIS